MDYTVYGILQARILEWVAFPFSRGSSQPRDQAQVSRIAGGFFTSWATREAPVNSLKSNVCIWVIQLLLQLLVTSLSTYIQLGHQIKLYKSKGRTVSKTASVCFIKGKRFGIFSLGFHKSCWHLQKASVIWYWRPWKGHGSSRKGTLPTGWVNLEADYFSVEPLVRHLYCNFVKTLNRGCN